MTHATELRLPEVRLELAGELAAALDADSSGLRDALSEELAALADHLGLPGTPDVTIAPARTQRAVRLLVGGQACPTSLALLRRTWLDVAPKELSRLPLDESGPDATTHEWLRDFAVNAGAAERATLKRYVARLVFETLSLHPAPLVSAPVTERYLALANLPHVPVADAQVALCALLSLGVSVRRRELAGPLLTECLEVRGGPESVIEELFARMAAQSLEIRVNPAAVGQSASTDGSPRLAIANDALAPDLRRFGAGVTRHLHELGVSRDILLTPDQTLPADHIRLRVNDRLGPPIPLAHPDEVVAQVSPNGLARHGIFGRPLIDAASGHRLVAVPSDASDELRKVRVHPLTPAEFMVVAAGREIASLAGRLLDINDVERDLASLEQSDPELVIAVVGRIGRARLTRVLRRLLEEQVSCRDLWTILNALLRYDPVPLPRPGLRVFDPRIAVVSPELGLRDAPVDDVVAFVRKQMPERIAYDSGLRGEQLSDSTLPVLRTDSAVDAWLHGRAPGHQDPGDDDLRWEAGCALGSAGTPSDPVILTAPGSRAALRAVLADEFPTVRVLSTDEVPPGTSIDTRRVISRP